jgi:hypothetical protein
MSIFIMDGSSADLVKLGATTGFQYASSRFCLLP